MGTQHKNLECEMSKHQPILPTIKSSRKTRKKSYKFILYVVLIVVLTWISGLGVFFNNKNNDIQSQSQDLVDDQNQPLKHLKNRYMQIKEVLDQQKTSLENLMKNLASMKK